MFRIITLLILITVPLYSPAQGPCVLDLHDTTLIYHAPCTLQGPKILYEFTKTTLRPESFDSLNLFICFLKHNPTLVVEIGVHADSRIVPGCSKPTQARAKTVYDYLVSKGIDPARMVPKGYGEHQLLISDAEIKKLKTQAEKDAAHAKNRRTELKVLRIDYKPTQVVPEKK